MVSAQQLTATNPSLKLLTPYSTTESSRAFIKTADSSLYDVQISSFGYIQRAHISETEANTFYAAVVTNEDEKKALVELMKTVKRISAVFFVGVSPLNASAFESQQTPVKTFTFYDYSPGIGSVVVALISRFFGGANAWEIFAPGCMDKSAQVELKTAICFLTKNPNSLKSKFPRYALNFTPTPRYTPMASWTFKNEGKSLLLLIVVGAIFAYIGLNRIPRLIGLPKLI